VHVKTICCKYTAQRSKQKLLDVQGLLQTDKSVLFGHLQPTSRNNVSCAGILTEDTDITQKILINKERLESDLRIIYCTVSGTESHTVPNDMSVLRDEF
jgi:hypothetical protein